MQFYCDIHTQGWQYKVYIKTINAVDQVTTVAPVDISPEATKIMGQTLYTNVWQPGIIHLSYTKGRALLNSTRDGYKFLEQLPLIV